MFTILRFFRDRDNQNQVSRPSRDRDFIPELAYFTH